MPPKVCRECSDQSQSWLAGLRTFFGSQEAALLARLADIDQSREHLEAEAFLLSQHLRQQESMCLAERAQIQESQVESRQQVELNEQWATGFRELESEARANKEKSRQTRHHEEELQSELRKAKSVLNFEKGVGSRYSRSHAPVVQCLRAESATSSLDVERLSSLLATAEEEIQFYEERFFEERSQAGILSEKLAAERAATECLTVGLREHRSKCEELKVQRDTQSLSVTESAAGASRRSEELASAMKTLANEAPPRAVKVSEPRKANSNDVADRQPSNIQMTTHHEVHCTSSKKGKVQNGVIRRTDDDGHPKEPLEAGLIRASRGLLPPPSGKAPQPPFWSTPDPPLDPSPDPPDKELDLTSLSEFPALGSGSTELPAAASSKAAPKSLGVALGQCRSRRERLYS